MNTTEEKAAIEKLLSTYSHALNASDVSGTVALYTKDGMIMPNSAPLSQQLEATYTGLYKTFQLNVEYFTDDIHVNGDNAWARTHSTGNTLIRATGETMPVDNKELFLLQKENGEWKISHYMFNNNKMK